MAKFRLVFEAESNKENPRILKLNIAPSKTQGFVNFINVCAKEDRPIQVYFEKEEGGVRERSKVKGVFKFENE